LLGEAWWRPGTRCRAALVRPGDRNSARSSVERMIAQHQNGGRRRRQINVGEVQAEAEPTNRVRSGDLSGRRRRLVGSGCPVGRRAERSHRPHRQTARGGRRGGAGHEGQRQQRLQEQREACDYYADAAARAGQEFLSAMSRGVHRSIPRRLARRGRADLSNRRPDAAQHGGADRHGRRGRMTQSERRVRG
jgi:hypothetical protein